MCLTGLSDWDRASAAASRPVRTKIPPPPAPISRMRAMAVSLSAAESGVTAATVRWTANLLHLDHGRPYRDEAEMARNIQDAGFVPKRRRMDYTIVGDPYCWSQVTASPEVPKASCCS